MSETKSINELMAELDALLVWFNSGEVDIDEAVKKFDEATKIADQIKERLAETENRIKEIELKLGEI